MQNSFEYENGVKAKDHISRFTGVVTGRADYLTGCRQYLLIPHVKEDGSYKDGHGFDEDRLELIAEREKTELATAEAPGGPEGSAPKT